MGTFIYTSGGQGATTWSTHRLHGGSDTDCCCFTERVCASAMRSRNRASWRSFDTNPFLCSSALLQLLLLSLVDGLSDDMARMPDHENGDGRSTRLARFCNATNGRTPAPGLASADDDLTAVSPDGGGGDCDWTKDLIGPVISSTTCTPFLCTYILEHARALVAG